jgi:hypothetical protein
VARAVFGNCSATIVAGYRAQRPGALTWIDGEHFVETAAAADTVGSARAILIGIK